MNPSHIHTVQSTVRNGCVMFFGAIFEVPPELHVALQGTTVQVDYHVRDASGVRLRTQGDSIVCWAPRFGGPDQSQATPVSPASGTTERQSHADGPSAPAPSGGHPDHFSKSALEMVREYRVTEPLITKLARDFSVGQRSDEHIDAALAVLHAQHEQIGELIHALHAQHADGA